MKKAEVVAALAEELKISKATATKAFGVVMDCIEGALKKGDKVTFVGFGTFSVAQRKARKGRNPRTGKEIKIAAKKVPRFKAGASLKAAVSGKAPAKKAVAKPKKIAAKPKKR
jgi:DNA-binding protein HU-beta